MLMAAAPQRVSTAPQPLPRQVRRAQRTSGSLLVAAVLAGISMSMLWGCWRCFFASAGPAGAVSDSPDSRRAALADEGRRTTAAPAAATALAGRVGRATARSAPGAVARRAAEELPGTGKRLLVLGGSGYVGRRVCRLGIERGYEVTSLSRRGENPDDGDDLLREVKWVKGDAADFNVMKDLVGNSDLVVHAIGLLFDSQSGLANLNIIVSGSNSVPGEESTYDRVTRQTAFNLIEAIKGKLRLPFAPPTPVGFVSAAEAGWPDVFLGPQVETIVPSFLRNYLAAKRKVEAEFAANTNSIRSVIFRPSFIWDWTKLDILPLVPVMNLLSAIGVPFTDKCVTVDTLSRAIIAALEDDAVNGVQRFPEMEALEERIAS